MTACFGLNYFSYEGKKFQGINLTIISVCSKSFNYIFIYLFDY